MAVDARQLARRQAVVSHLPAVEELGGIDVLCSDKTGTLTQNRLAVASPWTVPGVNPPDLPAAAALASQAEDRDPIDLSVLTAAPDRDAARQRVTGFVPFVPVTKRTAATICGDSGREFRVSKGAPQVIAALCAGDPAAAQAAAVAGEFAAPGYRSLGVARADARGSRRLLGVLPLADPPREDSAATITAAGSSRRGDHAGPVPRALVVLASRGPQRLVDLARALQVTPPTAGRMCDRLLRKGLIRRHRARADRREVQVSITAAGKHVVNQATARRRELLAEILSRLPARRQAAVAMALQALAAAAGEVPDSQWPQQAPGPDAAGVFKITTRKAALVPASTRAAEPA